MLRRFGVLVLVLIVVRSVHLSPQHGPQAGLIPKKFYNDQIESQTALVSEISESKKIKI